MAERPKPERVVFEHNHTLYVEDIPGALVATHLRQTKPFETKEQFIEAVLALHGEKPQTAASVEIVTPDEPEEAEGQGSTPFTAPSPIAAPRRPGRPRKGK